MSPMTRRSAARRTAIVAVLLGVLGVVVAVAAFGASGPPAPSFTSTPPNPTNQTAWTFGFSEPPSGGSSQCRLDAAAFAACTTPTTRAYSGIAAGSHTFRVRSVDTKGVVGSEAVYTWTVDLTLPGAPTIGLLPASVPAWTRTTASSFAFTGEAGATFQCRVDGSPFVACVSGVSYTVSQGTHVFDVKQRDAAGNLGTAVASRTWQVDSIPPPLPVFDQVPDDPSPMASVEFTFDKGAPAASTVKLECQIENQGPWFECTSPQKFTVDTHDLGNHWFTVRAFDQAGNISVTDYRWKTDPGVQFVLSGNADGLLYPGVERKIPVVVTNSKEFPIKLVSLTVTVTTEPGTCSSAANLDLVQATGIGTSTPIVVPPHSSVTVPPAQQPTLTLTNLPATNQDLCKNVTFGLTYNGVAVK